ncbi:hypothetical protein ACB092_05G297800 [Castanea dentata]
MLLLVRWCQTLLVNLRFFAITVVWTLSKLLLRQSLKTSTSITLMTPLKANLCPRRSMVCSLSRFVTWFLFPIYSRTPHTHRAATELKCGGLVVACTFDHRIADAYSANLFLVSWAEMAQSKPISTVPCFRRSLLNPRRPGSIHPSLNDMYVPVTSFPPPKDPQPGDDYLISRIYYIKADQLNLLQSLATTTNGCRRTKLESFSAFLWKMVAKHAILNNVDKKVTKMGIVVDGRTRLSDGDIDKASLMGCYFGNVLSIPYGGKDVNEIDENPLSYVANEVHEFLDGAVTKEHFLGLIDWVESHRPVLGLAKIYCSGSEDGPAFVVSSGQRFPESKVDFGWGKPLFGSYHFPWGGDSGHVMPMPSPSCNGDWVVYMHLLKGQVELIETEAAHLFRPLSFDYLQHPNKE